MREQTNPSMSLVFPDFGRRALKLQFSEMTSINWSRVLGLGAIVIITAETSALLWFYMKELTRKPSQKKKIYHKVLFFPDKKIPCQKYLLTPKGCVRKTCPFSHDESSSFMQLIRHVLNAKHSIDLCMFSITCHELACAVMIKYHQGAKVRLITDTEYMNLTGSKIQEFLKEGIPVRHDRSSYLMHHKFLIVDSADVITGSFNWTQAAVIGNNENVLVTNHPDVGVPYVNEFERLWQSFAVEAGDCG